jgi:septum formation protein
MRGLWDVKNRKTNGDRPTNTPMTPPSDVPAGPRASLRSRLAAQGPLILGSTSRYRAELLHRLGIAFEQDAPDVDERVLDDETPLTLARRLAQAKAQEVALRHPRSWVLGSDQVCACGPSVLGKPVTRDNAVAQLRLLSGNSARFITAVALARADGTLLTAIDFTTVRFRPLGIEEIERYVDREPAFDCAGSFKSEGLGISLCAAVETKDPTALVGLPLIAVRELLAQAGIPLP